MNTGLLRHAVATVLTVYGIETLISRLSILFSYFSLQQCLPFTVLKLESCFWRETTGIFGCNSAYRLRYWNNISLLYPLYTYSKVATVLTVYGIETLSSSMVNSLWMNALQQCLPFTVLKRRTLATTDSISITLQQCLPFTVLKLNLIFWFHPKLLA